MRSSMRLFATLFMSLVLTVIFVSADAAPAFAAGELDNEALVTNEQVQASRDLPATVVVRVNEATKQVEVFHSNEALSADTASLEAVAAMPFVTMAVTAGQSVAGGELDQDSSRSSWYFCFNNYNWYAPTYYYSGYQYSYSNYYSSYWGGYSYSYYSWNRGWWY